jgi:hypothetical protein
MATVARREVCQGTLQPMGQQLPTNLVSWISVQRCGYPKDPSEREKHDT